MIQRLLSNAISGSLNEISTKAMAEKIITSQEWQSCCLPDSDGSHTHTLAILTAIQTVIHLDPSKIYEFINILDEEGPPISNLADNLSK